MDQTHEPNLDPAPFLCGLAQPTSKPGFNPGFFLWSVLWGLSIMAFPLRSVHAAAREQTLEVSEPEAKTLEELSDEEKRALVIEYLKAGDQYFDQMDYDHAGAAYEQVFLLDPQNALASARIDQLKKQLLKEGKSETALIGRVYGTEIEARAHFYWEQAARLFKEGKRGQARLALEKLLLLNPLHKEARQMYEAMKKAEPQE